MTDIEKTLEGMSADEIEELMEQLKREFGMVDESGPCMSAVKGLLDSLNIKYSQLDSDCVSVAVGDGDGTTVYTRIFSLERGGIHLSTRDLVSFAHERRPRALELACELNSRYRFAKFCVDDDDTMHAEMDLPGYDEANLAVLKEFLASMVRVCFDALPEILKLG